jgi:hypothetical protein
MAAIRVDLVEAGQLHTVDTDHTSNEAIEADNIR